MKKTDSINTIFIKYFIFLVVLPIFLLGIVFYTIFNYFTYNELITKNKIISESVAKKLNNILDFSINDFINLKFLYESDKFDESFIKKTLQKYDFIENLFLINKDYKVEKSILDQKFLNFDYSYSNLLKEARRTKDIVYSEVYISDINNQQNMDIIIPFSKNKDDYFIKIVINVNKLLENISDIINNSNYILIITNQYDMIINLNNKLLINSLKKVNLQIKKNITYYNNKQYIAIKEIIPFNNWNLYLLQDINNFHMSLFFLRFLLLLIFISSFIISLFFFYLNFKHIFSPISYLTKATTHIAEGKYEIEKLENLKINEIKSLYDNFINMVNELQLREKHLRENEKKYRDLVEENIDSIVRIDSNLSIAYMSPSIEKILGYTNFELTNLIESNEIKNIFPDKHLNFIALYITKRAFLKNKTGQFILKCIHKDKYEIYIEVYITPVLDDKNKIKYVQAIIRDITRRYEAEKKAAFFRKYLFNIIDSLPIVIITLNSDLKIDYYNTASKKLFYEKIAKGKSLYEIFDNKEEYKKYFELVSSTNMPLDFQDQVSLDSKNYHFKFNIVPIKMDYPVYLVSIVDISDIKYMEKELAQVNKFKSISNIVRNLSHDINNIFGALSGEITLIEYKKNNNILNDLDDDIEIIKQATSKGQEIIKKISNIYKSENVDNFELIDINNVIRNVINKFQDCNIYFKEMNQSLITKGDQKMLEELFKNILTYSSLNILNQKDGKIRIIIENKNKNNKKYWEIHINDNGELVPQEDFDYIFDPFYKNSKTGKNFGTELTFAYKIAKLHNGSVEFYSDKNVGNKFTVTIPIAEDLEEQKTIKEELAIINKYNVKKGAGTILIIDDENIIRHTTGKMLQICGYNIIEASNGEEALKIYSEKYKDINCVMLDFFMPDMTGYDVYLEMKKINKDVKVVLSSGMKNHPKIIDAMKNGINFFIEKPYSIEKLSNIVYEIINS